MQSESLTIQQWELEKALDYARKEEYDVPEDDIDRDEFFADYLHDDDPSD